MGAINEELIRNFLLRSIFSTCDKDKFHMSGIKRAYRDFNRTLRIKDTKQKDWDEKRKSTEKFLQNELMKLISKEYQDQKAFDADHRKLCKDLQVEWDQLTIGQCQKWINMSLKYWVVLGVDGIERNLSLFHVPIDSYVLKGELCKGMTNKQGCWSKIDNYDTYFEYQKHIRQKYVGAIPLELEFNFFNDTDPNPQPSPSQT
mgnify:CR=1 FL=1